MAYSTVISMANSQSLIARVAACAAVEQIDPQPRRWAGDNILTIVATAPESLTAAWEAGAADFNANPDTGARTDVITDAMILSAVRALAAT